MADDENDRAWRGMDGAAHVTPDTVPDLVPGMPSRLPALTGVWPAGDEDAEGPPPIASPLGGTSLLPKAHALLAELERRRRGHEDVAIDLFRARS